MEQVVINLVKNSIEAIPENETGRINISLNAHGEEWSIHIADNGKGVDADKVNQLFIPFFSTKQNGSGIGLSLSKSIVQSHRGKLQLLPSESGALFEIKLPITPVF